MLLSNWTSRGQFWQLKEVICVDDGGAVENRGPLYQLGSWNGNYQTSISSNSNFPWKPLINTCLLVARVHWLSSPPSCICQNHAIWWITNLLSRRQDCFRGILHLWGKKLYPQYEIGWTKAHVQLHKLIFSCHVRKRAGNTKLEKNGSKLLETDWEGGSSWTERAPGAMLFNRIRTTTLTHAHSL